MAKSVTAKLQSGNDGSHREGIILATLKLSTQAASQAATNEKGLNRQSAKSLILLVAGRGFEPLTFGL